MKNWTLPLLAAVLAQTACSGGGSGTMVDEMPATQGDPGNAQDPQGSGSALEPLDVSRLINGPQIGPEPNFWTCNLRQNDTPVVLETSYQYFADSSGVSTLGSTQVIFDWDVFGADSGHFDVINNSGPIPFERWFVTMTSPTVFSAAIAYRQTTNELARASIATSNANINCILDTDTGPVNPDDEELLDQFNDNPDTGTEDINVEQALLNENSAFGLESQLWSCIAIDNSIDVLIGFFPNGIGGLYNTLNGQLEGTQSTYTVSVTDGVGTVSIDAVIGDQAQQLQFSSVIFERRNQFDATFLSTADNMNVLVSCNTISTEELAL